MRNLKKLTGGAAALCVLVPAAFSPAAIVYSQLSTTGLTLSTATAPTQLDDVTLAVGSTLLSPQRLSAMTFGIAVLPSTTAQTAVAFIDFYDTFNPAATTNVVSNYLGGFGVTLNLTANTSTTTTSLRPFNVTGLENLTTPVNFTDDNIAVVVTVANAAGTAYSTIATPFSSAPGVPTVGASVTGVYRDTNNDGVFGPTELNAALGNGYLSITTNPVPEPASLAAIGTLSCFGLRRRR